VVDAPTLPLAFEIEGKIGLLASLTDLWFYAHQGVNVRAFILTTVFGGFIGLFLGTC
jgi:hypothetical protein